MAASTPQSRADDLAPCDLRRHLDFWTMRIALTGADGQLGLALQQVLAGHEVLCLTWPTFDLLSPDAEQQVHDARPDVIIHAAAYTDVDGAEREPDRAMAVNTIGTERVAKAAAARGARLVYISTDYVFDGHKGAPYEEADMPNPLNAYGRSKLEGERRALSICPGALVVRTAWLYGTGGKNFVTTIATLAGDRAELRVVADQRGCPTYARDLAEVLASLVEAKVEGIVHATGSGGCTWHELATGIVSELGLSTKIIPITTAEANRLAPRPAYSVLSNEKLATLGLSLPFWRESLRRFLDDACLRRDASAVRHTR